MLAVVIGRAAELETIEHFLAALASGPAALVFEGEPGIGKTTLVKAGVEAANRQGARVLSCAPSSPETRLSYAALADLFRELDEAALGGLPPPQRDALDAALLRSAPGTTDVDGRAVATAVLSVVEGLAQERAVVVAIDDVQWLDPPSARVVEFCARRLAGRVGLIASRRAGAEGAWVKALTRLRERDRERVHAVAGFDIGDLARVLDERAERRLERRVLARVHEVSGGNPFYALELARAAPADGPLPPALPLPASLEEIVATRMAGLGEEVEGVLLAVAALADPSVELLERALGPAVAEMLDEAEARGMIELDGQRVRFTHPLLSNGVYARAPSGRRRAMHRRLSAAVADHEERARHLALAGAGPEALAALDEAAREVRVRGAPDAAAELLELALELGGDPELRVRAAEHHFDAGDTQRAQAPLEEAIAALPAGASRAEALLLLGETRYHDDSFPEARPLLEQARAEAGEDDRLLVMIGLRLAFTLYNLGLTADAGAVARSALTRAERYGDQPLLAQALAVSTIVDFSLGLGLDEARLQRALELGDPDRRTGVELYPALIAAFVFLWSGRFDESRAHLSAVCAQHAARGEDHAFAWARFTAVWLETWSGDLVAASSAADEAWEGLRLLDTGNGNALALTARAQVDACAGRAQAARRGCREALAYFGNAGWQTWSWFPIVTLGFLELSVGDYEAAAGALEPLAAMAISTDLPDPAPAGMLFAGDAAEALVGVGRSEEAETITSLLEERGEALDRPWAIAVGARCRGLLLAAGGDVPGAEQALERALVTHERLPMPIERARSLLVLGRIRRRLRKRRAAKTALGEALAVFEAVGSPLWAEQARAEIGRLGLRRSPPDDLTPSEERVASLAAEGLTNREVAASLFVSPKTVEASLARAYRKLGIRSRAELGARMAQRDGPSEQ